MTQMATSKLVEAQSRAVEVEAVEVLGDLRAALSELIAELPPPVLRAVDLEQSLGLDKKLAWQIFRVVQSPHPLGEVHNIPARSSVRRLLVSARKRRVSMRVIDRMDTAFATFERFVAMYAGNRESLVSVLNGLGQRKDAPYETKLRKSHFRTASQLWGIHAQTLIRTSIFHAQPGPEFVLDSALIQAAIGLERVRVSEATDVTIMMRTKGTPQTAGDAPPAPIRHPAELLDEFCTGPRPELPPHAEGGAEGESKLRLPPGRTGAATVYWMQWHEAMSRALSTDYYGRTFVTIPTQTLVWELLLPAGWTDPGTARCCMYACREHPEQAFAERASELMPQQESVQYLGSLDSVPLLGGSPNHAGAVRRVLEKLGWSGTRYDVYRASVQYPLLHTMLALRVDAVKGN